MFQDDDEQFISTTSGEPGRDLAFRIDLLTTEDWKGINKRSDRGYGGFFASRYSSSVLPWRGAHKYAAHLLFELDPRLTHWK
jgi:hypothetical protein